MNWHEETMQVTGRMVGELKVFLRQCKAHDIPVPTFVTAKYKDECARYARLKARKKAIEKSAAFLKGPSNDG